MVPQALENAGLGPDGPGLWLLMAATIFAAGSLLVSLLVLLRSPRSNFARIEPSELSQIKEAIATTDRIMRDETARMRTEAEARGEVLREHIQKGMEANRAALDGRLDAFGQAQAKAAEGLRFEVGKSVARFGEGLKLDVGALSKSVNERMGLFTDALKAQQAAFEKAVAERLATMTESLAMVTRTNAEAHVQLRQTVEQQLEKLRADNEKKLEQMRATVDEKLQSTLEKRLGESFKHVSERLEQVHRGLGEMQTLAIGVGDLKKVLTNVKDRGGWAEVQLGALLDQMLARDQYVMNARIDAESQEAVEYAVRLPGVDSDGEVLLPIDAKFPKEDYERLVAAWESGDAEGARAALDALEKVIEAEARKISEKYIRPPKTTDFAILFLPTEGLFAEAMRRAGLAARLQTQYRVTVAGPTTLAALLTSLQMGFRTLAIQKRSSEVWRVLAEAKTEFQRYGDVWEKVGKQLQTVQKTVDAAGTRTRAVTRKLKDVETIDLPAIEEEFSLAPIEGLGEETAPDDAVD